MEGWVAAHILGPPAWCVLEAKWRWGSVEFTGQPSVGFSESPYHKAKNRRTIELDIFLLFWPQSAWRSMYPCPYVHIHTTYSIDWWFSQWAILSWFWRLTSDITPWGLCSDECIPGSSNLGSYITIFNSIDLSFHFLLCMDLCQTTLNIRSFLVLESGKFNTTALWGFVSVKGLPFSDSCTALACGVFTW